MSIYTKTGDTGTTALFGGKRVLKCNELVEVYGSLDEFNSWMGFLASLFLVPDVHIFLTAIQADLFTIGGYLAGWRTVSLDPLRIRIKEMEKRIDAMEKELTPLTNFILPGGTELASRLHIARSVCRRVERQVVALKKIDAVEIKEITEKDVHQIIQYLNRLSDLLFTLARFVNKTEGFTDVVWSGINRQRKE